VQKRQAKMGCIRMKEGAKNTDKRVKKDRQEGGDRQNSAKTTDINGV